jgi:hypothetical protein
LGDAGSIFSEKFTDFQPEGKKLNYVEKDGGRLSLCQGLAKGLESLGTKASAKCLNGK